MITVIDSNARMAIRQNEETRKAVCNRLKKLVIADNMELLDFSNKDKNGFVEYEAGLFIRDITSELGLSLGITNLHIMVKNDMEINSHRHITQGQMVGVKRGKLIDLDDDNGGEYFPGDVFFVRKNRMHRLKYFAGSQYLITFMPALHETDE